MTGHQESDLAGLIAAGIRHTAEDFNLTYNHNNRSIILSDGENTLEMFHKQRMSSLNGAGRIPYYNFRACIIARLKLRTNE